MGFITGALIGAGSFLIGKLISTGKEMYRDDLITKKELEEIKAKSKAFESLVNYNKHKLDLAYDLEIQFLDRVMELLDNTYSLTEKLIDKVDALDDNSPKIHFYIETVKNIQERAMQLLGTLNSDEGKYYNSISIRDASVSMIDFHNETAIGSRDTQEKNRDDLISILPSLPKLPKK